MKIVIVLDEKLPAGIMANTSAALAMSCSLKIPGLIGEDAKDADMNIHPGLLTVPVPVLCGCRGCPARDAVGQVLRRIEVGR